MDPATVAHLIAGRGIVGNANQGGRRQVTLLSREHWNDVTAPLRAGREGGRFPDPSVRRANMLLTGIDLRASLGKVLRIGRVRIRILGETRPCERMDEACAGLRAALSVPWGGGAFGEVLSDGDIHVGDRADWEEELSNCRIGKLGN